MKAYAFVPARSGSKGLPDKNIRPIGGHPLLAYAIASLGSTLSKLSMDVCLYMSQNFGFLGLPKELTTGSSIMPHKKNPDVFEMLRAKGNKLQALPFEISLIVATLTTAGLGILLATQKRLMASGQGLKLLNLNPHILEIFEMAGFTRIFEIE